MWRGTLRLWKIFRSNKFHNFAGKAIHYRQNNHRKISYKETGMRLESKRKELIEGKDILNAMHPFLRPSTVHGNFDKFHWYLKGSAICVLPFSADLYFLIAMVPKFKCVQRNVVVFLRRLPAFGDVLTVAVCCNQ